MEECYFQQSRRLKQASAKSNTLPSAFFSFFELYKWYQIAQNIAYLCAVKDVRASSLYFVQSFHKQVFTQLLVKNQYKYKNSWKLQVCLSICDLFVDIRH